MRPGQRALDVGSGPGGLRRALAGVVGPANVAAVDPSETFVANRRERVPGADVRLGVAEALPFPDEAFDVVLSQLVVNFMADAEAGVREMRRVARPGAPSPPACGTCVRSVLGADIPNNEGFFRTIEVIAPPGTITNCVLPAACAARGLTGFRMVDACFGALAQMLPDRVPAASDGGATGVCIGGYHPDRTPFILVDFLMSAWGGRPWADGLDGNAHIFGNLASQPAEVCELEHPVEVLAFEFIPDSGGPGKHRGGMSLRRDYRLLEAEATLQVRADRHAVPPYGLQGGRPGRPSQNYLVTPAGEMRRLPAKVTMTMQRGEVFRHEQAGGGGWGDPLARDPELVLRDVRNELVSPAAARDDYGVVIDPATGTVDRAATEARRAALRAARGG